MSNFKRSTVWLDAAGFTTQGILYAQPQSMIVADGTAVIENDIAAISNAGVLEAWWGVPSFATPSPASAIYESCGDYALLTFLCADGTLVTVKVPAPKSTIFKADQQTVDSSVAGVATLIADCVGGLLSASSSVAVSYQSGIRRRRTRDYP